MKINGYTRMAAVVAQPIKHSLSPFIHNLAFDLMQENGVYVAWEVESTDLSACVENVRRLNMYGLNISMPYKHAVLELLDELTPAAQLIGAVNTVVNHDGKLVGHNTDGIGFFKSLEKVEFDVKKQVITVIGGGGAAIAIIVQAALLGAKKINVLARQSSSYELLKLRLSDLKLQTGIEIELTDLSVLTEVQKRISESKLLVNATSVGMDGRSMPLSAEISLSDQLVVDVIYKISETPFLKWAKLKGNQVENGLGMLLGQAAESFELWTGKVMPVEKIAEELEKNEKITD